jgi:hypothetical protein
VKASGYKGDMKDIVLVNKRGLSYEGVIDAISKATGLVPGNIGIRSIEAELLKKGEAPASGRLLEVQAIKLNGENVYVAMDSYQTLLRIMTELKEGMTLEALNIPGVSYDKLTGIFKYLPKSMPIDYGKELSTYREAIRLISTAA